MICTEIIRQHHDVLQAGHGETAKTTELLCRTYYWPELRHEVKRHLKNCDTCQRTKSTCHTPYGQPQPLEIPDKPWKSTDMDFITDHPESETNNAILIVIDRLTKMSPFIQGRKDMNTKWFKMLFINNIYRLHGLRADQTTDRDMLFTLDFWKETTKQLQIERRMRTAFHTQTDRQTERTNAILEQYLQAYVNYLQDNWTELFPLAEFAYNNSKQETIKHTPFFANYRYYPTYESTGHLTPQENTNLSQLHDTLSEKITLAP